MSGTPPPPPPPPPGAPPPAWTPPPPTAAPKKKSKTLVIIVAVVVILAVILGGLYAAGDFKPASSSSGSSPGGGSGETFKWTLAGGSGVSLSSSVAVNQTLLNESFDFGCHTQALPGAATLTSFPATTSPASSGDSNFWVVVFGNSTGTALEVAVIDGVATPVLIVPSFETCGMSSDLLNLPTDIEDSPTPAAAAWADGGSAYAGTQSTYDVELIVLNVSELGGPIWAITYTNCNPSEPTTGATLDGNSPAQFTAVFYAVNGTLAFSDNTHTACPVLAGSGGGGGGGGGKVNLDNCDSDFIAFQYNNSTTYWYNGTADCSTGSAVVTTGDVTVSAVTNTSTPTSVSTVGWTLTIQNISTGANLSHYDFTTNTWNNTSTPILSILSIDNLLILTAPSNVSADNLLITATSSAPVTGTLTWYLSQNL
jgi:hypothetical protein